jgi:hypothetical protein
VLQYYLLGSLWRPRRLINNAKKIFLNIIFYTTTTTTTTNKFFISWNHKEKPCSVAYRISLHTHIGILQLVCSCDYKIDVPLCPPQIPYNLIWAAVVGSQRLTAWTNLSPDLTPLQYSFTCISRMLCRGHHWYRHFARTCCDNKIYSSYGLLNKYDLNWIHTHLSCHSQCPHRTTVKCTSQNLNT